MVFTPFSVAISTQMIFLLTWDTPSLILEAVMDTTMKLTWTQLAGITYRKLLAVDRRAAADYWEFITYSRPCSEQSFRSIEHLANAFK